jgi:hypothetical protein
MPEAPTASMALVLPTEGGDAGEYDRYLNDALELVDAHDHSTGKGVKVKTNGLDIDSDLTFASGGSYSAITNVKAVDFQPHAASAMTAYAGAFFVNSTDSNNLYFRTQAGSNVRITNGATLDTTTSGGIGGDYAAIPAELNFVDASKTYTFKSTAAGNWSRLQAGALRLTEFGTTESTYVEFAAPAVLGASYTLTFPSAVPGASGTLMQVTTGGTVAFSNTGLAASTFTGLVTASAGVTAAADQHVTVSGTGEFKHGDRIMNITVQSGFGNLAGITNPAGTTYAVSGAAGSDWFMSLPLTVGDRVKSITWHYRRGAGTHTFQFRATTLSTGADADIGTPPTDAAGTTYTSITQSSINKTLVSTEAYYLRWNFSATSATNLLHAVLVTYDRP